MAYNTSVSSRKQAVASDTALKIKQEQKIASDLSALYFLPIARSLKKSLSNGEGIPHFSEHDDKLKKVLDKHYSKTSDVFISQVRDELGDPEHADVINEQINSENSLMQTRDISIDHGSITKTTSNDINGIVHAAIIGAAIAGIALTNRQLAKQATGKFREGIAGRMGNISTIQTQQASETAKNTEMKTLIRNNAIFPKKKVDLSKDVIEKQWHTIIDGKERTSHRAADLQKVPFDMPYVVQNQKLMHPGDTSLGATMDNIAGCRCSSVKIITRKK